MPFVTADTPIPTLPSNTVSVVPCTLSTPPPSITSLDVVSSPAIALIDRSALPKPFRPSLIARRRGQVT